MPVRSSPPPFVLAAALGLAALGLGPVRPVIADDGDVAPLVPPPPPVAAVESGQEGEAAAETKPAPRSWHARLAEGIEESRKVQKPILVRVGAEWCGWCKRLDREIVDPAVQAELAKWVLVEIDVDEAPEDAARLAIGPIPALRVLDASGRTVRSTEGFLPAEELVKWLQGKESGDAAMSDAVAEIPPLSAETLPELVRLLGHRDVRVREAVSRSLAADPKEAGGAVVAGFIKGTLVTRLTALEILSVWKAPVADLDPWQPRTVTSERLEALEEWAESLPASPALNADGAPDAGEGAPKAAMLTPADLEEARREIAKLEAADPIELEAIGARLAHRGPLLLPEVQAQRERAASQTLRERLDWLRYRLVSSDALALKWPAGLFGLASADASRRHAVAAELKETVTPGDEALLIELLRHPDPLVRELSLKALGGIEGTRSRQELAKLLSDPDANVRAAVLKEMAARPDPALVPEVLAYLEREQDADLIVSAVRMLQEAETSEAREGLMKLLKHASWQVRAEVVEGLAKTFPHSYERSNLDPAEQKQVVKVYTAVLERLEDEDGFVVSRAVLALKECDMAAAAAPLARTAERRPELATAVAEALAGGDTIGAKAEDILRGWLKHAHENLRAAAITGLQARSTLDGEGELVPALSDAHESVRLAATRALLEQLGHLRTSTDADVNGGEAFGMEVSPSSSGGLGGLLNLVFGTKIEAAVPDPPLPPPPAAPDAPSAPAAPVPAPDVDVQSGTIVVPGAAEGGLDPSAVEAWLAAVRSGEGRPEWMSQAVEPLRVQLTSMSTAERVSAGVALTALGDDAALDPLLAIARQDGSQVIPVGDVLGWLPRPARLTTFRTLRGLVHGRDELLHLCYLLGELQEPGSSELLWEVLREPETDGAVAEVALERLLHLNGSAFYDYSGPSTSRKSSSLGLEALRPHVESRHEWECRTALAALLRTEPDQALGAALGVAGDATRSEALRADAFAIGLYALDPRDAREAAVAALVSGDRIRSGPALILLAFDHAALPQSAIQDFPLPMNSRWNSGMAAQERVGVRPPLPAELTPDHVRPLLDSDNETVSLLARYVLAVLGEPVDVGPLIARWRKEGSPRYGSLRWDRPVFEALAERNRAADVPVLEEIYEFLRKEYDTDAVREFYWTIRTMTGPEVLALRKRIRAEVGMEALQ